MFEVGAGASPFFYSEPVKNRSAPEHWSHCAYFYYADAPDYAVLVFVKQYKK